MARRLIERLKKLVNCDISKVFFVCAMKCLTEIRRAQSTLRRQLLKCLDTMHTLATFTALLLVGLASTAPHSDVLHIIDEMFSDELAIYTGEAEITQIVVPLNALNFVDEPEDEDAVSSALDDTLIFFIEKGKGINALKNKVATPILANGNDITATADDGKQVFFAASDGIYTYNAEKKTAEKYGNLTDNIKGIAVANGTDELYILTDNHVVYKVSDEGKHKEEITNIKNARQIVLDSENNLYYVDDKKHVYVYLQEDGAVKQIKGLPGHRMSVKLLRPPVVIDESVPVIVGKKAFLAYANGTSEFTEIVLDVKPSAFSLEASLLLFVGHNHKIYEYNLLNIMLAIEAESLGLSSVKTFFGDQTAEIQSLATKPINSIRV